MEGMLIFLCINLILSERKLMMLVGDHNFNSENMLPLNKSGKSKNIVNAH